MHIYHLRFLLLFYHNPESEANDESVKLTDNLEMSGDMIIFGGNTLTESGKSPASIANIRLT